MSDGPYRTPGDGPEKAPAPEPRVDHSQGLFLVTMKLVTSATECLQKAAQADQDLSSVLNSEGPPPYKLGHYDDVYRERLLATLDEIKILRGHLEQSSRALVLAASKGGS